MLIEINSSMQTLNQNCDIREICTSISTPRKFNLLLIFLVLAVILLPVHEILHKHTSIQYQRAKTAQQPAKVHRDVFAIYRACFSRRTHTVLAPAPWVVHQDAKYVCKIPKTCKQEEQHADALGGLATIVEEKLRYAGTQVEDSTDVAGDLAPEIEVQSRIGGVVVAVVV